MLPAIEIETAPNPRATLIVLHGLGADGNDFVPVCEALQVDPIGPLRYVLPHAPARPVSVNNGYVMPAWYDIFELGGSHTLRREDEAGLRASQARVGELIEREVQRGVPASRIVLAGFSQGCAVTLMTGLRYPERLAGLAGLSGYLPLAERTAAERSPANADVPIFLAHGTRDPMIAHARAVESRDALGALGYDVEWHDYPMEHSVSLQEIADLNRWLVAVLRPAA
jgi:phospholipase/carboxylesterase